MDEQFTRAAMLLGEDGMEKLWHSHVAVFGVGGVGSWCAEALARSGVGAITIIDHDDVGLTNLNRQAEALHSTLGQPKAEAMAARIRDISPKCTVTPVVAKYDAEHREEIFSSDWTYIVDAIDLVSCKLDLIETARSRGIPMISALGTGNKLDPTLFRISSIAETEGCPLARVVRKELRKRGITDHRVLWSPELPAATGDSGETPPPGRRAIPASVAWVPACAGLMMAGDVIRTITGK